MTDQTPDAARERLLDEIEDFREDTVSADTVLNALDAYAAAVSRSRDAAWREEVEAMRKNENHPDETQSWIAITHNAALDALLARMEAK